MPPKRKSARTARTSGASTSEPEQKKQKEEHTPQITKMAGPHFETLQLHAGCVAAGVRLLEVEAPTNNG